MILHLFRKLRFLNYICVLFLGFLISESFIQAQTTLYSYKSGNWNDPDTWTTDPGGTTLVGSQIPGNNDIVVILASRIVQLPSNVASTGLDVSIRSGGILEMNTFQFTNTLASLSGNGVLRIRSASFPAATVNTFVQSGGGTTEYRNTGAFTLPSSQAEYNNLTINLSTNTFIVSQLHNLIINGNLNVTSGNFQINNNNPARLQLTISGNVTVSSGSSITVGTGNTTTTTNPIGITGGTEPFVNYYDQNTHRVVIQGDFTNNGTVRFTNQSHPVYNAFPTNGAASVYFTGATNNSLTCNNTTDFYNLIVNKGTDQTYVLSLNSSGYQNFRLFGANTSGGEGGGNNPILKKALWIRNGTLRLYGLVVIPSLSEGTCDGGLSGGPNSDFYIPTNGALVIDGPDVVVLTTADSYLELNAAYGTTAPNDAATGISVGGCSSFSVLGKFQIDDGYISTRESGGFIYWATTSGQFIVNGGTLDSKQFRTANSSGGLTAYRQTNGTVTLRGRFQRNVTGVNSIAGLKAVPLNTTRASNGINGDVGTFNLDQDANIFEMTGGTIEILDVCGQDAGGISRAFEVNSLPAYCNVTGGSIIIRPTTGSGTDYTYYFVSAAPVGNFSVIQSSGTQSVRLINITKAGVTARNPSLNVLNHIILSGTNATLNANGYHVETGGNFDIPTGTTYTPGNNRTVFDGSGNQTFTGNGTITSGFSTLRVDKASGTVTLTGTPASFTIRDSLQIVSGTLNDGGKQLNTAGHIYVGGIHTGTGRIILNGSANQNITFEISGNPTLGNVQLSNTAGATLINNGTMNSFTFSVNALMNINQYRLTVNTLPIAGYNQNRYFITSGIASNGGLRLAVNAATLTTGNSVVFPIGVTAKYTPATIVGNNSPGAGTGYVTFIPVNSTHPSQNPSGRHLNYYWRSIATGMPAVSNVYYQLYNNIGGDWESGVNRAYTLLMGTTGWNNGGTGSQPDVIINGVPNSQGFISADITAGNNGAFNNVNAYYSIASGPYNSNDVWSTTSHTGADCNCHPSDASDIVYIGGNAATSRNDSITVTQNFNASSITINGSYTGNNRMPVLNIQNFGGGSTVDIIKGDGKFSTTSATIPASDYGEFVNSATAVFNYHGGTYTIGTTLTAYPNLLITGNANNTIKTLPNSNVVVNRNLILSAGYTGNTLVYNGTGGNLTVYGNVNMRNASLLQLTGNSARYLNVYGDINLRYLNSDVANTINVNAGTGAHQVRFYGNLITMGQSTINLTNSILTVYDPGNAIITDRTGGTGTITFNRLVINKDVLNDTVTIQHPFALSGVTNNYPKALELVVGTLVLNNSNISLVLSSGGANFSIPQTTALILKGASTVSVTGNNTGISLDGLLKAQNTSVINLGDGSTTDTRYIEYSGSGNAFIELTDNATLRVNSQIRRSLLQTNGVLSYRQSGNSTAIIYGQGASLSRAKLEIDNTGSEFTMSGGSLTIVRGGGTTYGDLFLRPESGNVSGGTIFLGTQNTGSAQTILMDASLPLNHLTLDAVGTANEFKLMVHPLTLKGNLLINNNNSTFNTNSLDVSLKGNFTNNGTYTPGLNMTTFNGVTQAIGGTTSTQFYNLLIQPSTSVTVNNHITVNKDLNLVSGTFSTGLNNIQIKGDLINNAIHSGDNSTGGLIMNGTSEQEISGSGVFGRLELNNTAGARLLTNISLQQDFLLTNGILNINQYLLTLGVNSNIIGSGFNANKMIMPDGVFSNVGIKKYFNATDSEFTYPIGVTGKYTPAVLTILDNPSGGSVRLNAINLPHPTVTDPANVLQYYWEVGSSGLSTFEGNLVLDYVQSDVSGSEADYVAARLIVPPGEDWSKAAAGSLTDNVDEDQNKISFNFPSGTTNLGGEYTAGNDAAIPDEVPVYTSNGDGNWDDVTKWTPEAPAGGPNGFIVIIRAGDVISTNGNRRFAYMTTLNGRLNVGTSYGHNLGSVNGTGTLYLESNILPAGRFTTFFNCSGGTLEYGGNTDYTIIADRLDTIHNLYFTGTGNRELPDKDLVICDTLKIDGPALINSSNRKLTLFGVFRRLNTGTFSSGTGNNATVVFAGTIPQTIGGIHGTFTGPNALNNLEINNSAGLTLNSALQINGNLLLTQGTIHSTTANLLAMLNGNSVVIPSGGSATSYVSGPLSKRIFGGNDFDFPTGKNSRYGKTTLLGVSDGTWQSEYFNSAYATLTVTAPLTEVSNSEYWHVKGPAANTAYVKLRWDPLSDVTPLTTLNGISDIRVAEYNGASWEAKNTSSSGDNFNGTAQTTGKMNLDEHDYTLGSISLLKPRASFINTDDICNGEIIQVLFSKAAGSYTFSYSINGTPNSVTTSSNPYTLNTTIAGRYRLTSFTGGVVDTNSVLVLPVPTAGLTSDDADNAICSGDDVTFTASGGTLYDFRINNVTVQNGASSTYTSSLLEDGDVVTVNVTNGSGCSDMSSSITMTVYNLPVPSISGLGTACEEETQIYNTDSNPGITNYIWTVTGGSYSGETTDAITITWDPVTSQYEDQQITVNYTDSHGCTASNPSEMDVRVYRVPQTGPTYYIPNAHNE